MLKRVVPFILTLLIGTFLGSWFDISSYRKKLAADYPGISHQGRFIQDREWAVFKKQPVVDYTAAALRNHVVGRVRLRVLLGADGKVPSVVTLETLPDGLTEAAVSAARNIEFVPAMKNGRPVSVWVEIVHEFTGRGVLSYCRDNVYSEDDFSDDADGLSNE